MAGEERNWLELPSDVMADILYRVGVVDILENAQKVCTTWRKICKDPSMWRVIEMEFVPLSYTMLQFEKMCMHAVQRSEGQLVDISIVGFGSTELLLYIANRSSQLRRLQICPPLSLSDGWPEALEKFPLLEEVSLYSIFFPKEAIEAAGHYCHMLKTLKLNQRACMLWDKDDDMEAIAIGENLTELRHLELIGNSMSNIGLKVILDSCHHLELLDLRRCENINLDGGLGKSCSEQIKYLRLPNDSLEGCPYISDSDSDSLEGCPYISDSDNDSDSEFDICFNYYGGYNDFSDWDGYSD